MSNLFFRKMIVFVLILNLAGVGAPQLAYAELIGTQKLMDSQTRDGRLARINAVLARDEIREQFIKMGVDPRDAQERVAALTDAELAMLEQRLESLPAGGSVLAIIGIVFVVLIILELVGVTNVFTRL